MTMKICPVILSGGSGTRLWPLSREHYPKQLLPLVSERSLLQETVLRLDGLQEVSAPIVVCNEEHRFLVAEQLRQIDQTATTILLEPVGRNTAPALALAAEALKATNGDAIILAMPADHVVQDGPGFRAAAVAGAQLAAQGHIVTFGIVPKSPETGYGYIRRAQPLGATAGAEAWHVDRFVEKPDRDTAERYLAAGGYFWNSGIFMVKASTWLEELTRFRADIAAACAEAYARGRADGDFYRIAKDAFTACPSDSIDYAVLEKTDRAVVMPLDVGWSDVGAWPAIRAACVHNGEGNVIKGDVLAHATRNTLVIAQSRFVATVGIEDLVVIETADAVLVAHKDRAQEVKGIVERLQQDGRIEAKTHRRVYRPWGSYEGVDSGARFQVKRIIVNPGAALSLQMHHHRAEHWIVVKGTARVTRGDEVFMITENQSTYIPIGTRHRLENPGAIPLEMIEVQSGSYLGEDDIVRFEDIYNRHNT
jgi:mannose-1-phosphate guanylyltransferase / mannose-6-phosphate isomerase